MKRVWLSRRPLWSLALFFFSVSLAHSSVCPPSPNSNSRPVFASSPKHRPLPNRPWLAAPPKLLAAKQGRFALLVGVSVYPQEANYLASPVKDASRMEAFLRSKGFVVRRLLNEEATAPNIRKEMNWLVEKGQDPNAALVFYYSGHGSQLENPESSEPDKKDETLFPYSENPKERSSHITDKEIQTFGEKIKAKALLIFDSCHSGSMSTSGARNLRKGTWKAKDWINFFYTQFHFKEYCGGPSCPIRVPPPVSDDPSQNLPEIEEESGSITPEATNIDRPPFDLVKNGHKSASLARSGFDVQGSNVLLLSASKDTERAVDGGNGSVLTNAILRTLRQTDALKLTHQAFFQRVQKNVRLASNYFYVELCKKESLCRPKLKELRTYFASTEDITIQHPQLEGKGTLKDSKVFFLEDDPSNTSASTPAPAPAPPLRTLPTEITAYLRGFKPEAHDTWEKKLLPPFHVRSVASEENADISITHDGQTLRIFYQKKTFVELSAGRGVGPKLKEDFTRTVQAIRLLKEWHRFQRKEEDLRVQILRSNPGNSPSESPLPGDSVAIGDRLRFQITPKAPCYSVVFHLSNEGRMDVLHPLKPADEIQLAKGVFSFPPGGWFRVSEPKGLGLLLAFCTQDAQSVAALRSRILSGQFQPPSSLDSAIQRVILTYFVQ